jgi:tetratricopeptide (TPR) repeat protein
MQAELTHVARAFLFLAVGCLSGLVLAADEPVAAPEQPAESAASGEPATIEPTSEEPAAEVPAAEEPAAEQPAAEVPAEQPQTLSQQAYAASRTAKTEADYDKVIELSQQAEAEAKDDAARTYVRKLRSWALNRRGEAKVGRGDDPGALADFEEAVALEPDRWKAIYNRGVSLAQAGKLTEALADLDRAIELQDAFAKARYNRGEVKFALGDLDGAIRDYDQTVRLDPRHSAAYNARGFAYNAQGNFQQALRDFDQALRVEPDNAAALVNRGDAYADRGDYGRAVSDYQRAVQVDGQSARAHLSWAWLLATCPYERYRNPQLAVRYAQRANELLGEEHYRFLDVLAAARASAGQFPEAQEAAAKVVELAPEGEKSKYQARLDLYAANRPLRDTRGSRGAAVRVQGR